MYSVIIIIFAVNNQLNHHTMNQDERSFFKDVKNAVSDYDCSFKHYHEDGQFCVDVKVDLDEWGDCGDEIWDALSDVASDWGGNIDSDMNIYYLGVSLD